MVVEYTVDENACTTYDDLIAAQDAHLQKVLTEWEAAGEEWRAELTEMAFSTMEEWLSELEYLEEEHNEYLKRLLAK